MKLDVIKLDGGKAGSVDLDEALFGLEPRADILHRVVRWQRNNAQQGTHKVKTRSETSYSTKKIYRQKGTGGARHGDRNAPIFRKGGIYKGPTPRSHGHELTKKFRKLGLRHVRWSSSTKPHPKEKQPLWPNRCRTWVGSARWSSMALRSTRTSHRPRATSKGWMSCRRWAQTSMTSSSVTLW